MKKFIANLRRKLFNQRVNREIFDKIFPHLNQEANHGYPFDSDDEMVRLHIRNNLQAGLNLRRIGEVAAKMPKAYSDAFRYIA
jgi:predicted component of type VI protein secretion system